MKINYFPKKSLFIGVGMLVLFGNISFAQLGNQSKKDTTVSAIAVKKDTAIEQDKKNILVYL